MYIGNEYPKNQAGNIIHTFVHMYIYVYTKGVHYGTANLIIIDVRYQLSTVFSTSLLLENR
jgi:hypothetical protein